MSRRRYDAATAEAPSSGIALEPLRNCTELSLRQIARGLAPSSGDGTVGLLSDPGAARPQSYCRWDTTMPFVYFKMFTTTVYRNMRQWRVIPRLRMPGTMPGGYPEYPDPLRGCVFNRDHD